MASDFVEDWAIIQTLGEGAYGEVKLLVNKESGDMVAMKVIDLLRNPEAKECVKKEVAIQKMLRSPHIIRFYGTRQQGNIEYIFLEYAPHGELFDRIEPDVGMPQHQAQQFLLQLLSGVEYLHSRGVAHRDIKPENLLLDSNDNIKISDFGLATLFRVGGKERALDRKCGTMPYVAPEVLLRPYAAQPADVWACGIVLVAMLAGELPWDKAGDDCRDYKCWLKGSIAGVSPWSKLEPLALSLVKRILTPLPSTRYSIQNIKSHRWSTTSFQEEKADSPEGVSYSQPEWRPQSLCSPQDDVALPVSFSQPTHAHDMLLSSQLMNTQTPLTSQNCMQKLVRRMTRFLVTLSTEDALKQLISVLDELGLAWKLTSPLLVTISTVDKRKNALVFKSMILEMNPHTLIDFRLSKGCGLEFKRHFCTLRKSFSEHIAAASIMASPSQ